MTYSLHGATTLNHPLKTAESTETIPQALLDDVTELVSLSNKSTLLPEHIDECIRIAMRLSGAIFDHTNGEEFSVRQFITQASSSAQADTNTSLDNINIAICALLILRCHHANPLCASHTVAGCLLALALGMQAPKNQRHIQMAIRKTLQRNKYFITADVVKISPIIKTLKGSNDPVLLFSQLHLHSWQWSLVWSVCLLRKDKIKSLSSQSLKIYRASPYLSRVVMDSFFVMLDNAEPVPFPVNYKLSQPPESLLNVLRLLQKPRLDVPKLVSAIEKESSFSAFIQHAASQSNRLSLPVKTIKQGVMTYGIERIGDMLTEHALFQRLNQNHFPLREQLIQHIKRVQLFAAEIAACTGTALPQTLSLIALTRHIVLLTHPGLKQRLSWRMFPSSVISVHSLLPGFDSSTYADAALKVAKAWRFSPRLITYLKQSFNESKPTNQFNTHALAALWASQVYTGEFDTSCHVNRLEESLCKALNVPISVKRTASHTGQHLLTCPYPQLR